MALKNLKIPSETHRRLRIAAATAGSTITETGRCAIDAWLGDNRQLWETGRRIKDKIQRELNK